MTIRNIAISCRQQFFLISTCPFRYTFLLFFFSPPIHSLSLLLLRFFYFFPFPPHAHTSALFLVSPLFTTLLRAQPSSLVSRKTIEQAFAEYEKFVRKAKQCFETLLPPPPLNTLKYVGNSIKLEERDEKKKL